MFNKIFIEKDVTDNQYAKNILDKLGRTAEEINRYDDIWGKVKKPYLQKRDNLNLFIAKKRGVLVKETPDAYGTKNGKHYYFIHAYNCIYECQYCYLQGYFNTPDIVLFVNHEEIIQDMQKIVDENPNETIWFHAGEFSDSLALTHLTNEFPIYWDFFEKNPQAMLELRTKSVNLKMIKEQPPLENIIMSFSLSPEDQTKELDLKTPQLKSRLRAIEELAQLNFNIGIHLDPITYTANFNENYTKLISSLESVLPSTQLSYMSIGVVRFTKDVYSVFKKNYPDSTIHNTEFIRSFDDKMRYIRPMRGHILSTVERIIDQSHFDKQLVYRCME